MIRLLKKRTGAPRTRPMWTPTTASTSFGESTFAELSWDKSRGAGLRWALAGTLFGLAVACVIFAPAAWLAGWIANASSQRLILGDARGTVWSGSAVVALTGGSDSRDAAALPGRIEWTLRSHGLLGLEFRARHACCLNGDLVLQVTPGFGRVGVTLLPTSGWIAQWPTGLLAGLGTPWNTMQLGGKLRLLSPGMKIESVQGRWRLEGRADLDLDQMSSRLTTLDALGSYRMSVSGDPASAGTSLLELTTRERALQLNGNGTIGPAGVRFRGEATAVSGSEAALASLLNIIGRRSGARSVISIG